MIDLVPNETVLIMWPIFLVVLFVLNKLVFKPTLEIVEKRAGQTSVLKEEAEKLSTKAKELLAQYEKRIASSRTQALQAREAILVEARQQERRIIAEARKENDQVLEGMKSRLEQEKKEATLKLRQYAQDLARTMVDRVLERDVA